MGRNAPHRFLPRTVEFPIMLKHVMVWMFLLLTLSPTLAEEESALSAEFSVVDLGVQVRRPGQRFGLQERGIRAFVEISNRSSKVFKNVEIVGTFSNQYGQVMFTDRITAKIDRRSTTQSVLYWSNPARILGTEVKVEMTYQKGEESHTIDVPLVDPNSNKVYNTRNSSR